MTFVTENNKSTVDAIISTVLVEDKKLRRNIVELNSYESMRHETGPSSEEMVKEHSVDVLTNSSLCNSCRHSLTTHSA